MKTYWPALALAFLPANVLAQNCTETPDVHAVRILGTDQSGARSDLDFPEVAGDRSFFQQMDNGWVFALMKAEEGWSIRLYEHDRIGDAVDLTSMTPPYQGEPNPRDIFGWHFRNGDNTGPNTGDVNAPQHLRAFVITPSLAGTGGYRPSTNPNEPRYQEPGRDDGIGWLQILEFGLAGLDPGSKARMNYLKFDACLTWPKLEDEKSAQADLASTTYTDEDLETFGSCGLDLKTYALNAAYLPRKLGGDIDGDEAIDEVAQIVRRADDARGLALCRAGAWMHVVGLDDETIGEGVRSGYIGQVEAWQWVGLTDEAPQHIQGMDLPQADGDLLILERIEKEAVALYWKNGSLRAKHLYHIVEP